MFDQNACVQSPSSSAPAPSPPSDSSRPQSRLRPLTVQPNATVPPRGSILTPPPSAHPTSLSSSSFSQNHPCAVVATTMTHTPPPPPNHVPGVVAPRVNASIQPPTRLQNPLHVPSSNYPQQPQRQQQQVSIQENGVVHAQLARCPPGWAPPQVVTELAAATPKLRPVTLPLEQQQQQQQQQQQRMMTHSTTTATTATRPASASAQARPNQSQLYPIPVQVSTRGQQPVQLASAVPGAPGTQKRPQSVHTQTSERIRKLSSPVSVPSSSPSTQSRAQQQQQQQQQQHNSNSSSSSSNNNSRKMPPCLHLLLPLSGCSSRQRLSLRRRGQPLWMR
ncbi:hypothetical protein V8E52_001836 [Russula decolorans]